jgi:hypothetical protein
LLTRLLVFACIVASGAAAIVAGSDAHAAPLPSAWCGPAQSDADLPDAVAGSQIHVIYAHAADVPNRFELWAPRIARDLAGVDTWWQTQDPTRTPRFDLADFPDCDSTFGRLDISTFALDQPAAAYNPVDDGQAVAVLRSEVVRRFSTLSARGKLPLVFLDLPVSSSGNVYCGFASSGGLVPGAGAAFVFLQSSPGCAVGGGYGTGNGWPAGTAAHELIHMLSDRNPPNACPADGGHVCDSDRDIMAVGRTSVLLSQAVLDVNRDDYYGHGDAARRDVRDSAWLTHLDESPSPVSVAISASGAGKVSSAVSGIECPPRCDATFDSNAVVFMAAEPDPGYVFRQWAGDCQGVLATCSVHLDGGPKSLVAQFVPLVQVEVRVVGNGWVWSDGRRCGGTCVWERPLGSTITVLTQPLRRMPFVEWSGSCDGERKRCKTEVKRRTTVKAKFAKRRD